MEFAINNTVYRTGKLDAFKQLHIVRRLTPCLGKLASLAGKDIDIEGDTTEILAALSGAITVLSDEDVEYVLNACLDVAERKQPGGGWAGMRVNGALMYAADITLPAMLQIAWHVIQDNLADFSVALPSLSAMMKGKASPG